MELIRSQMTRHEAEEAAKRFTGHWTAARVELLDMFERGAHKALGYETFPEFAQDRLNINVADITIKQHLAAARVERNVSAGDSSKSILSIPVKAALELNKLPDTEQADAWKEVRSLESYGTHLPKDVARALRDIVTRRLNRSATKVIAANPAPVAPIEPPRPKPNLVPIVPETYDTGPEFDEEPIVEAPKSVEVPTPAKTSPAVIASPLPTATHTQEETLLCAAVKILRQFRHAVKTANQDQLYEADAASAKFLKDYEASGL